ncbi:MAG: DNA helicase RecG, partial [Defluviitaleaceae bacterium]|nr:DNA helicase RecG [Defluviitaleaceae bacterium]
ILISTTVVEVGVNVPNATIMLIENAERFGLSQLHQLRGRVGRGQKKSFCILISDSKNKITKERLAAMTRTNDGFELSELDLKLRGPGEFFGTAQHGLPALRLANLYRDLDVLESAKDAAAALIAKDPDISSPAHVPLLKRINQKLGGFGDISL